MTERTAETPGTADRVDETAMNVRERSERLSNIIYRHLFEEIKKGSFAAGDRLPTERRIMVQFRASRSTVRKALARLVEDGYITRQAGSGSYVMQPSERLDISSNSAMIVSPLDVLEARRAIEPGFVDLVALRGTEADFDRMARRLDEQEGADDLESFRRAGYAFHLEIACATRNPLLIRLFETVVEARAAAGWQKLRELNDTDEARRSQVAANRKLLAALRMRDAGAARDQLRLNLWRMIATVAEIAADG